MSPEAPEVDEPRPFDRVELPAVAVAVAAGLVLRFWTSSHLWLDEALTVDIARLPLTDIVDALRHDGHPPLYYWLLHGWMRLFGEGDAAVRALSGVCSVLALLPAWAVGRRLAGRAGAVGGVAVLALSPFAIRYANEARMYALVSLLVACGWLLVLRALERPSGARLVPAAALTTALLLTHYWSMWLVAATGLVLLPSAVRGAGPARVAARRVLGALLAGCVLYLPWVPVLLDQSRHTGTPWAGVARPATIVVDTLRDLGGGDFAEAVLLGWALAGLFVVGTFAVSSEARRLVLDLVPRAAVRAPAAVVALTLGLGWAGSLVAGTTYASRYAAVVTPIFGAVAGVGLALVPAPVARRLALAVVVVLGLVGGIDDVRTDRTQAGEVAAALRASAHPGDLVVLCPDQLGPALTRVVRTDVTVMAFPAMGDGRFVDWRDYADRNAAADPAGFAADVLARAPAGATVWLVSNPTYKTFEGRCEALDGALGASGRGRSVLVAMNPDRYFEAASLIGFTPPP